MLESQVIPLTSTQFVLAQEWDAVSWGDIQALRETTYARIGFDLYADPIFMEFAVCRMLGIKLTTKQSLYDGELDGIRFEIKHSNLGRSGLLELTRGKGFQWQSLNGNTNKGKPVQVFVLIGYDIESSRVLFFVVPRVIVGTRRSIRLYKKHLAGGNKWGSYLVSPERLKEAVITCNQQMLL